jgi:hypothetical protein
MRQAGIWIGAALLAWAACTGARADITVQRVKGNLPGDRPRVYSVRVEQADFQTIVAAFSNQTGIAVVEEPSNWPTPGLTVLYDLEFENRPFIEAVDRLGQVLHRQVQVDANPMRVHLSQNAPWGVPGLEQFERVAGSPTHMRARLQSITHRHSRSMMWGNQNELVLEFDVLRPNGDPVFQKVEFIPEKVLRAGGESLKVEDWYHSSLSDDFTTAWISRGEIRISLPDRKSPLKIARLKGQLVSMVPLTFDVLNVGGLSNDAAQQALWEKTNIKIGPLKSQGPHTWMLPVRVDRGGMAPAHWQKWARTLSLALSQALLKSKAGRPISQNGYSSTSGKDYIELVLRLQLPSGESQKKEVGDAPDSMEWRWPVDAETVRVPIDMKDVEVP